MSRSLTGWLVPLALCALALAGALWWVGSSARQPRSVPVPSPSASAVAVADAPARTSPAVDVLRHWDRARARAYARGDVTRLRSLYVPGSGAGTTDARLLRGYTRRGLRVDGIRMQLLEVAVLAYRRDLLRMRVTDRLVGAVAVDASGARLPLPRDAASTRTITLRRRHGTWKVAAVSG